MIEIKPMDENYILIDCLHHGAVDPSLPPKRGNEWQDAPDLPPHPWSDETIAELARKYRCISEGWRGDPAREFMREMIQRYGSCAILAWEDGKVVGFLRFYPLTIAHLVAEAGGEQMQPVMGSSKELDPDPAALGVQCVMTSRPFVKPDEAVKAGARKGVGLKLVHGLISWARKHGWKRVVKQAHADLDCMYGQYGGGGKAFWEKAGFKVIGTRYDEWPKEDDWKLLVESQAKVKGMSKEEMWTWYRMVYEL